MPYSPLTIYSSLTLAGFKLMIMRRIASTHRPEQKATLPQLAPSCSHTESASQTYGSRHAHRGCVELHGAGAQGDHGVHQGQVAVLKALQVAQQLVLCAMQKRESSSQQSSGGVSGSWLASSDEWHSCAILPASWLACTISAAAAANPADPGAQLALVQEPHRCGRS